VSVFGVDRFCVGVRAFIALIDCVLFLFRFVREMMLFTPSDSYKYEASYPNCTAWPNCTAGTMDNIFHVLLSRMLDPVAGGSPTKAPANCPAQME
jgi:hypothetical protein